MKGVELEQLFAQQQEEEEAEEAAMGYRGLAGPPNRRPSGLIARLYERMTTSRKSSSGQPSNTASFDHPIHPDQLALKIEEPLAPTTDDHEAADDLQTPTNNIPGNPLDLPSGCPSRVSSRASSRKSSLKRQDRFDNDESIPPPPPPVFTFGLPLCGGYQSGPAVYVTDAETASTSSVLVHPREVDPIFAVLQLAAEAYRVRLDSGRPVLVRRPEEDDGAEDCDWNHNGSQMEDLESVRQELRRELDKTDDLLGRLRTRLTLDDLPGGGNDPTNLRSILDDVNDFHLERIFTSSSEISDSADDGPFAAPAGPSSAGVELAARRRCHPSSGAI